MMMTPGEIVMAFGVGWNVIVRRPSYAVPGKGFKAQADRAATNGGTLEARRAGTSTAA
jgi:hypothetical protein